MGKTRDGARIVRARKAGVTFEKLIELEAAGQKFCYGCRLWKPRGAKTSHGTTVVRVCAATAEERGSASRPRCIKSQSIQTQWCDEGIDHPAAEQTFDGGPRISWCISGGESGSHARPSHPRWFRSLRDQCEAADVPFHHKQNGEFVHVDDAIQLGLTTTYDGKFQPYDHSLGVPMLRVGVKNAGRLLDGVLHDAVPTAERQAY